jgi:cytochrome P450
MNRGAEEDIVLSGGVKIRKGTRLMVEARHLDPVNFPDPHKFDAFRFAEMRKRPGEENNWQFSSTSPEYFGFGLGIHSCPG